MTTNLDATYIITVIVTLLISMSIHEFMHAYVGHRLGDDTAEREGRLTLNPLAHIDPLMTVVLPAITLILFHAPILAAKPVPFNPDRVRHDEFGAAMIAAAGPLSNLVLAIAGTVALNFLTIGSGAADAFKVFIELNVALFVFNSIPIPPLDGSRVLYAFAPDGLRELMAQIEPIGLMVVFGLVLLGGFGGFLGELNGFVLSLLGVS